MTFPQTTVTGDPVSQGLAVRIRVEVIEDFNNQSPARLRISVRNDAPEQRRFYFGYVIPFNPMANEVPEKRTLFVIPDNSSEARMAKHYSELIPEAPEDGCWRSQDHYLVPMSESVVTLGPGEDVSNTYAVLNAPNIENCPQLGTYRFESEWGVQDPDAEGKQRQSWGFQLKLFR